MICWAIQNRDQFSQEGYLPNWNPQQKSHRGWSVVVCATTSVAHAEPQVHVGKLEVEDNGSIAPKCLIN